VSWNNYGNQRNLTQEQEARRRAEREAEDLRYELERERERREREEEQRRRERQEAYQEQQRSATDWPTAFRKNRSLLLRERNQCYGNGDPEFDRDMNYLRESWDKSIAEVELAAQIWGEEQAALDEYVRQMRNRVAARLRRENPNSELAEYIENDDIDGWMDW
jgi:hypothetical protein